uniref:Uncharacterized protein n=1 Tax=Arundo donax TaxID=35708 RepID=A0A0A9I0M3_ARUDO
MRIPLPYNAKFQIQQCCSRNCKADKTRNIHTFEFFSLLFSYTCILPECKRVIVRDVRYLC